ncbi:MAG TPA: hypothetical protein VNP03_26930 [Pseudonocardia sp.]|nr:hypothetical protein [Pseudonocardia sp.]
MIGPRTTVAGLLTALVMLVPAQGTAAAATPPAPPVGAPPAGPAPVAGPPAAGPVVEPPAAADGAVADPPAADGVDDTAGAVQDVPPDPGPLAASDGGLDPAPGRPSNGGGEGDLTSFFGSLLTWTDHGSFGLDRARMVRDPSAPTGRLLRVTYPAGSASPTVTRDGGKAGGAQSYLHLPHSAEVMTLSYSVRFQPGFRFVKGGKLPGLFGGDAGSGGRHEAAGFSTRFMWRAGGAGEVYAYFPNAKGYGASLGRGRWKFTPGRWVKIAQRVVLNTPGRNNGTITVWVNGRQVFTQGGLTYRNKGNVQIDGLFFSTFFGGGDKSWVSPSNQHADFAGFSFVPARGPGPRRP